MTGATMVTPAAGPAIGLGEVRLSGGPPACGGLTFTGAGRRALPGVQDALAEARRRCSATSNPPAGRTRR